jgi:hypothetical protein
MRNWKNTIDLLTAANTRLNRVKEHVENTDKFYLRGNIEYIVAAIENVKRELKKGGQ